MLSPLSEKVSLARRCLQAFKAIRTSPE
jgi:hypothetical protein